MRSESPQVCASQRNRDGAISAYRLILVWSAEASGQRKHPVSGRGQRHEPITLILLPAQARRS